ncbi:MAG: hypothetical protein WAK20_01560 [Candidatus Acidiferrum sp.]
MDVTNHYLGVGIHGNIGVRPLGRALDVGCPECCAAVGERCHRIRGGIVIPEIGASHVERGRVARYSIMGVPPITAEERAA